MSNNNNKGASALASALQRRMAGVATGTKGVSVEMGEIVHGNKLKLYSIPGAILDRGDYSVCQGAVIKNEYFNHSHTCTCVNEDCSINISEPIHQDYSLKTGDKVLIVWTFDGEPVVVDKIG